MKRILTFTLILLGSLLVTVPAFSQNTKKSKKELLKENEQLRKTIDSLLNLLGEEIQVSDTTTVGDTINPGTNGFLNPEFYETAPGENQDTLLTLWYLQRQAAMAKTIGEDTPDIENANYKSDIPDEVYIENIKKMNSYIPVPYNSIVRNFIILYTEKMPKRASNILGLSTYYLPIFENIFDSYGLPKELSAMAIIESALNPFAVSRANAKGMWQFIYSAARQYDLNIDSYVDERFDPEKSCDAAARYLRDAYQIFGDWALAISSYNCGSGNVNKAIRRAGSKEFWDIYPYLPKETRGYVPSFIGALYLLKYYKNYNIVPEKVGMPPHVDTFMIHKNLHFEQISEVVGIPLDEIRQLNPQYLHDIIPGTSQGMILRLPYNYTVPFVDNEKTIYSYKDSIYFNPIVYNKYKEAQSDSRIIYHKVRKGQTLASIAKRYGVTTAQLKKWNRLGKNSVKPGETLAIYRKESSASQSTTKSSGGGSKTPATGGNYGTYTVKAGDTLYGIAKKHNMSLNDLLKINGLTTKSKIHAGKKLKVKK